jgi:T4-like virus Myoviridae tail sheath stabiliser
MEIRRNQDGTDVQKMVVPIDYGPKERWLTRLIQDPDFTKSVGQVVPRMSFEMTGVNYDGSRSQKMLDQMTFPSEDIRKRARVYVGVPYNINFELSILTKYQSDGFQIVEQIVPYFRPDLTFAMKPIPALGFLDTIPVILDSVNHSDNYEGDFEHRRIIVWTLNFKMRVYLYGPVRQGGKIMEVVVDIYNTTDPLGDEFFLDTEDGINNRILLEPQPDLLGNHLLDTIESIQSQAVGAPLISGYAVDEETSNAALSTGRIVRIDAKAVGESGSETVITEYDGDVKRNSEGTDEEV